MSVPTSSGPSRCGFVALIGAPNAGKSTLLNRLVGTKVSIVTHKVQTTRSTIRAMAIHGSSQIVFVDTPGIFHPKRRLDRAMLETAWRGARDADVVSLLIDAARGIDQEIEDVLEGLSVLKQSKILILNKIDTVERTKLLTLSEAANARVGFDQSFMVSALTGDGCDDLLAATAEAVPEGPWLYPDDQISDLPLGSVAAEITREKMLLRLHDELPYTSTVETTAWHERKDGSVRIDQTIYVARESHRKIVLGKGGKTIKAISQAARIEVTKAVERKVHLFLFVKVREKWADDPERYREIGLEFPRG